MIPVTQLRADTTFMSEDGYPYVVLKYEHTKMGRGNANIKVRARNLKTGAVLEKSFVSGSRVEEVSTAKRKLQYLYREGNGLLFMDPANFEQVTIKENLVGNRFKFLVEGNLVEVLFWTSSPSGEEPLDIQLPPKMEFQIAETEPGVKGNSATNLFKSAVLINGMAVRVPLFVQAGERILVDTRTGEYVERVK
ncbi:MAG: elongation factor P [bacterium]|nr:elongation factor P [bacterium]